MLRRIDCYSTASLIYVNFLMFIFYGHLLPRLAGFSSLCYSIRRQWAIDKRPYQMMLLSVFNNVFSHKEVEVNLWRDILGYSCLPVLGVKVALVNQVRFTLHFIDSSYSA